MIYRREQSVPFISEVCLMFLECGEVGPVEHQHPSCVELLCVILIFLLHQFITNQMTHLQTVSRVGSRAGFIYGGNTDLPSVLSFKCHH